MELVYSNRPTGTTWTGGISTGYGGDKMTRKRRSKSRIFQQDVLPVLSRRQLNLSLAKENKGNNLSALSGQYVCQVHFTGNYRAIRDRYPLLLTSITQSVTTSATSHYQRSRLLFTAVSTTNRAS